MPSLKILVYEKALVFLLFFYFPLDSQLDFLAYYRLKNEMLIRAHWLPILNPVDINESSPFYQNQDNDRHRIVDVKSEIKRHRCNTCSSDLKFVDRHVRNLSDLLKIDVVYSFEDR